MRLLGIPDLLRVNNKDRIELRLQVEALSLVLRHHEKVCRGTSRRHWSEVSPVYVWRRPAGSLPTPSRTVLLAAQPTYLPT